VGAKVRVRDGESVEKALKRLREQIRQWYRHPLFRPKPTKKRLDYRQKPCEVRHQQRSLAKTRQQANFNLILIEIELGFR
jgi:ribosomal protein S21